MRPAIDAPLTAVNERRKARRTMENSRETAMKTAAAAMTLGLLIALPSIARSAEATGMRGLIGERGCTVCHRDAPTSPGANGATPLAPSWKEIAAQYRGQPDVERRLTRIVIQGADPRERHWKNRQEFAQMAGNMRQITSDEARAMVRWILATP